MKITMYELLGMVKDGNIPKKIYYLGHYYTWKENDEDYQKEDGLMLFGNSKINYILDTPVEILEEEKKIPEKLYLSDYEDTTGKFDYDVLLTINEIIDYLDCLKSKGE